MDHYGFGVERVTRREDRLRNGWLIHFNQVAPIQKLLSDKLGFDVSTQTTITVS